MKEGITEWKYKWFDSNKKNEIKVKNDRNQWRERKNVKERTKEKKNKGKTGLMNEWKYDIFTWIKERKVK